MENLFKNPKSTAIGLLIAVVFGLLSMVHAGTFDIFSTPSATVAVPIISALILGALSTDNSPLVELFFNDWKTTAIGIASAFVTAILGTLAAGGLTPKVLIMAGITAIYGWVSTHKKPPPPPQLPIGQ